MALGKSRPGKIELSGKQFRKTDDLDSGRVGQQLIECFFAQGVQAFDELPRLLERLRFSDIAVQFEQGTLRDGHEHIWTAVRERLQAEPCAERGIE